MCKGFCLAFDRILIKCGISTYLQSQKLISAKKPARKKGFHDINAVVFGGSVHYVTMCIPSASKLSTSIFFQLVMKKSQKLNNLAHPLTKKDLCQQFFSVNLTKYYTVRKSSHKCKCLSSLISYFLH